MNYKQMYQSLIKTNYLMYKYNYEFEDIDLDLPN